MLESLKSYRSYARGETIVWAEEPLTHLGSIVRGAAFLDRTLEDGRTQIVGLMLPSDFIGRPDRRTVAHNVIAATDVTLCRFTKPVFERLLERSPAMMRRMLAMTNDDLDAARDWILLLGRKTARERVAGFLSLLARRTIREAGLPPRGALTLTLPVSRSDMANYVGMTPETASRQLSALRADGIIAIPSRHSIAIPDLAGLFREAREPG